MRMIVRLLSIAMVLSGCATASNGTPDDAAAARSDLAVDVEEIVTNLTELMSAQAYHGRFSGTVLVARGDTVIYLESFGFSDVTGGHPNTNDTVYGIGSIAKQFTAAGIMRLVENGQIELTDTVARFFPELGPFVERVTIHDLLSMSSGILEDFAQTKTYDLASVVLPKPTPIATAELLGYFGEVTEFFRPGRRFDYANINYVILAALIEKLSGTDLNSYLTEHFWTPLRLGSIAFGLENTDTPRVARAYTGIPLTHDEPEFWHDSWVLGAGGVYSTAHDLYRWMRTLSAGDVFSPDSTAALFGRHQRTGNEWYGYGWVTGQRHGRTYRYHEGGTVGYISEAGFYPDDDVYIVILSNHTHELERLGLTVRHMQDVARQLHSVLNGFPSNAPPVPVERSRTDLSGRYSVAGFEYEFRNDGEAVSIVAEQGSPSIMDVAFGRELTENTRRFRRVMRVAEALGNDDFRAIWWRAEIPLRIAISAGFVADAWANLTGEKGELVSVNFYRLPTEERPNVYWFRIVNSQAEHGVFVTLTRWGSVRGIQIDQAFSTNGPREVETVTISPDRLFVDGFRYGYPDLHITRRDGNWTITLPTEELPLE